MSFRDDIPRPEYDVQALRLTVADAERYPWGSIGCIRLGNRFFAWKAISDTIHLVDLDPSNAPDNAGTRFMELPALFGIGYAFRNPTMFTAVLEKRVLTIAHHSNERAANSFSGTHEKAPRSSI